MAQDSSFRTSPQMVEGHVVENDGRLWTLTLRDGLFHDGERVLARDCAPPSAAGPSATRSARR